MTDVMLDWAVDSGESHRKNPPDSQHAPDDGNDEADDGPLPPSRMLPFAQAVTAFVPHQNALATFQNQLVPFPTVIIQRGFAEVVFLVADATRVSDMGPPESVVENMMSMGRQIAFRVWATFSHEEGLRGALAALVCVTPDMKSFLDVDSTNVAPRACLSQRQALVLLPARTLHVRNALLYTYIGGRVPHQPPSTYRLVFKHMPVHIAACVAAVGAHLMGVPLQGSMVYCRDMNMSSAEVVQSEQEFLELVRLKGLALEP